MKKNTPIDSGTTVVDTIKYVCRKIYLHSTKDIDREEEEDRQTENEIMNHMKEKKTRSTKVGNNNNIDINAKNDNHADNDDNNDNTKVNDNDKNNKNDKNCKNDDNHNDNNNKNGDEDKDEDDDDDDDNDESLSEEEEDYVPDNYLFHSFFVYSIWRPFSNRNEQLPLLKFNDTSKSKILIVAESRVAKRKQKDLDYQLDKKNDRSFIIDQKFSLEAINISK